ncbi:MAG: methyltransferase, partial [Chloroflexi bacterium]|nr:methyltransferase [Chloroflexota bacterium]
IAKNRPESQICAVDISTEALEIARINCNKEEVSQQIQLLEGNLLDPVLDPVKLIIANLPYVNYSDLIHLDEEIRLYEPGVALYGGKDGLDVIREFLKQVSTNIWKPQCILLEIGYNQGNLLTQAVHHLLPEASIEVMKDYNKNDRLAIITGITKNIVRKKSSKTNVQTHCN